MDNFAASILSLGELDKREELEILQVNLGDMCNQQCLHCHVDASPRGTKIMPCEVMDDILRFLSAAGGLTLDLTGGCPELNPHFKYFVEKAAPLVRSVIVRNNLTVLLEPGMEAMAEFYKKHKVKLACSLPCYTRQNVDRQRGEGVFDKSIRALRLLNAAGYGYLETLQLDLVYNPGGPFLPGNQEQLEKDYRKNLNGLGVVFNRLLTLTNAPVNRFARSLTSSGELQGYMKLLSDNFNPEVTADIMCRRLISVGWDGRLYDCDFNQALGISLKDNRQREIKIAAATLESIRANRINFQDHCYCCTAAAGSSCFGNLK